MKRTRKSDAGDKVAGIKPIIEKNSMLFFFFIKLITFLIFPTHRRMPRLLHRSTARTQTSANVSVLPCNGMLESSRC